MEQPDREPMPRPSPCPECGDTGEVIEWYGDVQLFCPCPCGLPPTGTAGTSQPADDPVLAR